MELLLLQSASSAQGGFESARGSDADSGEEISEEARDETPANAGWLGSFDCASDGAPGDPMAGGDFANNDDEDDEDDEDDDDPMGWNECWLSPPPLPD